MGVVSLPELAFCKFCLNCAGHFRGATERQPEALCPILYCHLAASPAGTIRPGFELEDTAHADFRNEDAEVAPACVPRCAPISD